MNWLTGKALVTLSNQVALTLAVPVTHTLIILTHPPPLVRHNTTLSFYNEVPEILEALKDSEIHVAAASRTCAPDL